MTLKDLEFIIPQSQIVRVFQCDLLLGYLVPLENGHGEWRSVLSHFPPSCKVVSIETRDSESDLVLCLE